MLVGLNGAGEFDGVGLPIYAGRDIGIFIFIVVAGFGVVIVVIVAVVVVIREEIKVIIIPGCCYGTVLGCG